MYSFGQLPYGEMSGGEVSRSCFKKLSCVAVVSFPRERERHALLSCESPAREARERLGNEMEQK